MKLTETRSYSMEKRTESANLTEKKILKGLFDTWLENSLHDITLDKVAQRSGVTVRTILRKFGSKEGLFDAALKGDIGEMASRKNRTEAGNLESIMDTLMEEYEATGKAGIRTLALEHELTQAAELIAKGRRVHWAWCARVFAPYMIGLDAENQHQMVGALYVETDINCWKLLRIDFSFSEAETRQIMLTKLKGVLYAYTHSL